MASDAPELLQVVLQTLQTYASEAATRAGDILGNPGSSDGSSDGSSLDLKRILLLLAILYLSLLVLQAALGLVARAVRTAFNLLFWLVVLAMGLYVYSVGPQRALADLGAVAVRLRTLVLTDGGHLAQMGEWVVGEARGAGLWT